MFPLIGRIISGPTRKKKKPVRRRDDWNDETPCEPDGVALAVAVGAGALLWLASADNEPHFTTEMRVHTMPHISHLPTPGMGSIRDEIRFTRDALDFRRDVEPGCYAPAYRFIDTRTGHRSLWIGLPPVVVA